MKSRTAKKSISVSIAVSPREAREVSDIAIFLIPFWRNIEDFVGRHARQPIDVLKKFSDFLEALTAQDPVSTLPTFPDFLTKLNNAYLFIF